MQLHDFRSLICTRDTNRPDRLDELNLMLAVEACCLGAEQLHLPTTGAAKACCKVTAIAANNQRHTTVPTPLRSRLRD